MKNFKNKMKNKKGFTLMEMLIVVAIMVILVAVSVPVFSNKLGDAKKAADDANMQAARSVALTQVLVEGKANGKYYYDAASGTLVTTPPAAYGKDGKNAYIQIEVTGGAVTTTTWITTTP